MAMLQGYFDASGSKNQNAVISLAGFVTNSGKWNSFSEDWEKLLQDQHITVFKMLVEAKRKPEQERNARIAEFVAVIRQHVLFKIECSIKVPDFLGVVSEPINTVQAAWLPRRSHLVSLCKQLLDDCHFWVISNLVTAFGPGVWDRGFHHPFDLFFDEQLLEMSHAAIFYDIAKELAPPRFRRILPDQLISRKDTEFPPLQAADLFAWTARRNYQQEVEGWEWLIAELDAIESMQCFFLDKTRLTKQIGAFYEYILGLGPQFEDEQIKRWSKLIAA